MNSRNLAFLGTGHLEVMVAQYGKHRNNLHDRRKILGKDGGPGMTQDQVIARVRRTLAKHPGANPTDLEQLVVDKIEERVKELDDLKEMKSSIQDGLATVSMEFEPSVDADRKYDEVASSSCEPRSCSAPAACPSR